MAINDILDYFIEYESNERFMQSSLSGASGAEFTKEILGKADILKKTIIKKKKKLVLKDIQNKLNKKYIELLVGEEELEKEVEMLFYDKSVNRINEIVRFKSENIKTNFLIFASSLIEEEEITLCYPILEKDKTKHPVLSFIAKIENNQLNISKFYLNKTSLLVFIAHSKNIDLKDVEHYYSEDIIAALKRIESIQGQEQVGEILKLVNMIVKQYFGISDIMTFDKGHGWILLDKAFITSEQLNELYEPPFRKELSMVKQRIGKLDSSLVHKYLTVNPDQKKYEEIFNSPRFHFGSYTEEYPVNKKQWDVVTNVDTTQLLAVNGPPGTGKTTLLKEIIADKFVEKAKDLLSVWDQNWTKVNAGTKREVYQSPFKGANKNSIIITSTNNKAVDNIGKELLKEISYFQEYVSNDSKGLFCARLGKQKNVDVFKGEILTPLLNGLKETKVAQDLAKKDFLSVYQELEGLNKRFELLTRSATLLKDQLTADQFEEIKEHMQAEHIRFDNKLNQSNLVESSKNVELDELKRKLAAVQEEKKRNAKNRNKIEEKIKEKYIILEKYKSYQKTKFLNLLMKKRREFLTNYPTYDYILSLISSEEKKHVELENKKQQLKGEEDRLKKQQIEVELDLSKISSERSRLKGQKEKMEHSSSIMEEIKRNKEFVEAKLGIELSNFYDIYQLANCKKMVKMRKELFDLALVVHQEYITKHKEAIIHNLEKVKEDNRWFPAFYHPKQEFGTNYETGLRALWETLCMTFPVVTTTLHSFHSSNFHMISNLFDLMLVDESGQILPHYLVGPLYRSSRAIIVGDVYQLEPIRLQDNQLIETYKSIDENQHNCLCIERNSVQSYSDSRSDIYEEIRSDKVGVILEEHRRCENNIVQFSNQFVYDKKLIIVKEDNHEKLYGGNLVAFDVRGHQSKENVNELEVEICSRIVDQLLKSGLTSNDIAIITPYKNQAIALRNAVKGIDIGTVHTFQGQEKKVILFSSVIDKVDNARFVGNKPNMLNVAFTRAKEQIILIGNTKVALQSNNYLQKAADLIQRSGVIYSIYDLSLNKNAELVQMEQAMEVFTNQINHDGSPLSKYIMQHLDKGMIKGAQEHFSFLQAALELAQSSVVIISPWITHYVVDMKFQSKVKDLVKKNVDVKVLFGYHQSEYTVNQIDKIGTLDYKQTNSNQVIEAVLNLYKILGDNLIYSPPMHTKLLLIDDQYLIIGSYNWLSNSGIRRGVKDELSCILTDQRYIDYVKDAYLPVLEMS